MLCLAALATLFGATLSAQDAAGDWQGTIGGAGGLRVIVHVAKETNGRLKGLLYVPSQGPDGIAIDSVTVSGTDFKFFLGQVQGKYSGTLSADGASIDGIWNQGQPQPLNLKRATKETAWQLDPSPHKVQFVTVEPGVKLEVLDWGGSGRPLVFLAGLGNSGHIFDKFATNFTNSYHVYGITRRGFGVSSSPASGYSADRLADDVLAVLDSLKIKRPVLAGHSIAGEELSSIGTRHPEKVAGLIYLDAGYYYAYYDPKHPISGPPIPPGAVTGPSLLIMQGQQHYSDIHGPILALYATPHVVPPQIVGDSARAAFLKQDATFSQMADAFERGNPSAHVVRYPNADHYVFNSNEADVLKEMRAFISSLPPEKK
jgi:pimeloyl-ACP methyl ester carboxylesterase